MSPDFTAMALIVFEVPWPEIAIGALYRDEAVVGASPFSV